MTQNFFHILGIQHKEVIISKFLVKVLKANPDYLQQFTEQIGAQDFITTDQIDVVAEHPLKSRNNSDKFGRADIWLGNKCNQRIIIENKLYATDQWKQLSRYRQYLNEIPRSGKLFYLTIEERPAPTSSSITDNNKVLNSDDASKGYKYISYSNHIKPWLIDVSEQEANTKLGSLIKDFIPVIEQMTRIYKMAEKNVPIENVDKRDKNEYLAYLELKFWVELEKKIRKDNLNEPFDNRRHYNFEKIKKRHAGNKYGRAYGLIIKNFRIQVLPESKGLKYGLGSFDTNTWQWKKCSVINKTLEFINMNHAQEIAKEVFTEIKKKSTLSRQVCK